MAIERNSERVGMHQFAFISKSSDPIHITKKSEREFRSLSSEGHLVCPGCGGRLKYVNGEIKGLFFSHVGGENHGCASNPDFAGESIIHIFGKKVFTQNFISRLHISSEIKLFSKKYPEIFITRPGDKVELIKDSFKEEVSQDGSRFDVKGKAVLNGQTKNLYVEILNSHKVDFNKESRFKSITAQNDPDSILIEVDVKSFLKELISLDKVFTPLEMGVLMSRSDFVKNIEIIYPSPSLLSDFEKEKLARLEALEGQRLADIEAELQRQREENNKRIAERERLNRLEREAIAKSFEEKSQQFTIDVAKVFNSPIFKKETTYLEAPELEVHYIGNEKPSYPKIGNEQMTPGMGEWIKVLNTGLYEGIPYWSFKIFKNPPLTFEQLERYYPTLFEKYFKNISISDTK